MMATTSNQKTLTNLVWMTHPLIPLCQQGGQQELLKKLMCTVPSEINHKDKDGYTILFHAIWQRDIETVRTILEICPEAATQQIQEVASGHANPISPFAFLLRSCHSPLYIGKKEEFTPAWYTAKKFTTPLSATKSPKATDGLMEIGIAKLLVSAIKKVTDGDTSPRTTPLHLLVAPGPFHAPMNKSMWQWLMYVPSVTQGKNFVDFIMDEAPEWATIHDKDGNTPTHLIANPCCAHEKTFLTRLLGTKSPQSLLEKNGEGETALKVLCRNITIRADASLVKWLKNQFNCAKKQAPKTNAEGCTLKL